VIKKGEWKFTLFFVLGGVRWNWSLGALRWLRSFVAFALAALFHCLRAGCALSFPWR